MNSHWTHSNKFLQVLLLFAVTIVGVLATLVMHQRHVQSEVDRQVDLRTALTVPPSPAPQLTPTVQVTTTSITPALVTPESRAITPPRLAPSPPVPRKPKTSTHRRTKSVPAPPSKTAVHPAVPALQTDPGALTRSNASAKPGGPDGW